MKRRHRLIHRWVWAGLAPALAVLLCLALRAPDRGPGIAATSATPAVPAMPATPPASAAPGGG